MMRVDLLNYTMLPELLVATAAHQCVSNDDAQAYFRTVTVAAAEKAVRRPMEMGHTSVAEHVSFTFAISGVSRALSHQLVRFRVGVAFSQQSQRYVTIKSDIPVVIPPSIQNDQQAVELYQDLMVDIAGVYHRLLLLNIPAEDARFVLPNATETALIMTMNARELLHAFEQRLCQHAQWEIREMFQKVLHLVRPLALTIFEKAGPPCVSRKVCPEGTRSCGRLQNG